MAIFLGILPFIQAIAAVCTIYGFAHAANTSDIIVKYGVGEDGPSAIEWMNSFGSIAVGGVGLIVTWWMKQKHSSELLLAIMGEMKSPDDAAVLRRLAFAAIDWLENKLAVRYAGNTAMLKYWSDIIEAIRGEFSKPNASPLSAALLNAPKEQITVAPATN